MSLISSAIWNKAHSISVCGVCYSRLTTRPRKISGRTSTYPAQLQRIRTPGWSLPPAPTASGTLTRCHHTPGPSPGELSTRRAAVPKRPLDLLRVQGFKMVGARRLARPRLPDPKSGGSAIPRKPRAGKNDLEMPLSKRSPLVARLHSCKTPHPQRIVWVN